MAWQSRASIVAKTFYRIAVFRIQRIQVLTGTKHDALAGEKTAGPVYQTSKCRTALAFRLETPQLLARFRIDANHELAGRGDNHHVAHDDGIALDIVAAILGMIDPGNLQIGHILAVDLIQR